MKIYFIWCIFFIYIFSKYTTNCSGILCDRYKGKSTEHKNGFLNCFGDRVENGKSELLILLDSSGSMRYNDGFTVAKRFIESLLSEVRIAFNATRIAVGLFSDDSKIQINYILNPEYNNNKCRFKTAFKEKIKFIGGLTDLQGALSDAEQLFKRLFDDSKKHKLRSGTNKAVLLIGDGEGNVFNGDHSAKGKSVRVEAQRLKNSHFIEVYTVALTKQADQEALKYIATDESAFLYVDEFTDLKLLAEKIRGDPYEYDYETVRVPVDHCEECDADATCGCNLKSGDYRCVCNRGWYGTGEFKNNGRSCFECGINTYGDRRGYLEECPKCPENSVTTYKAGYPALSKHYCKCLNGYNGDPGRGIKCKPKPCSPPQEILKGHFINKTICNKAVFGDKCEYMCNKGYKIVENHDIICGSNQYWTKPYPKCQIISCPKEWGKKKLITTQCSKNSIINQKTSDESFAYGTTCTLTCNAALYQSKGNKNIRCLESGDWNFEPLQCGVAVCPKISRMDDFIYTHENDCFNKELSVGEICRFDCPSGYELRGKPIIECQHGIKAIGKWVYDMGILSNIPSCLDINPPKFLKGAACRNGINIEVNNELGKPYGVINFNVINVTDNSGKEPSVTCENENQTPCPYKMGKEYNFGVTKKRKVVTFVAKDEAGNSKTCKFYIIVRDKEKPTLISCPTDIVVYADDSNGGAVVSWKEPEYTDNFCQYPNCSITVSSNHQNNKVFYQKSQVKYTADDGYGNFNYKCLFNVNVKVKTCEVFKAPLNSVVTVAKELNILSCRSGTSNGFEGLSFFSCQNSKWKSSFSAITYPPPDCNKISDPDIVTEEAVAKFDGDCTSEAFLEKVKEEFEFFEVESVYCGERTVVGRRKKRSTKQLTLKLSISVNVSNKQLPVKTYKPEMDNQFLNTKKSIRDHKWSPLLKKYIIFQSIRVIGSLKFSCGSNGDEQIATTNKCVTCGPGTFKNMTSKKCVGCPPGTYQYMSGQTSCIKCDEGSIIVGSANKNASSCKKLCQPGEFSANGVQPCNFCSPGFYSDKPKSYACIACPGTSTIINAGGKSILECGSQCVPGTYSETGVEPCLPCPKGEYQDSYGGKMCNDCPDILSTPGEGTILKSSCVDINDCRSNPCLNSGHCIDLKDDYRCQCKDGYWGKNCEKEVDECALQPCRNNGTCIDKFKGYKCKCPVGLSGDICSTAISKCDSVSCGSHGSCVNLVDLKFKCVCDNAYTGEFCEAKINPCFSNPCRNEGYCQQSGKGFKCTCQQGFEGAACQKKTIHCSSNPCENKGSCIEQDYGFACNCRNGFEGLTCANQIDMCQYTKCHNGGECQSIVDGVVCKCAPGYSGHQCDTQNSNDFDFLYQSRVAASFSSIHGRMDLRAFTITFWMRSSDQENIGTPLSYAVMKNNKVDDNALVLTDYSNFNLWINNVTQPLQLVANDGLWHHIAVTWKSLTGAWKAYKDGRLVSSSSKPFQQGQVIGKGGVFVVGEEQDELGGGFTPGESFIGDLSQLHIWNSVLSETSINDSIHSCGHDQGNVVAWSDFSTGTLGRVIKTESSVACALNSIRRNFQLLQDHSLPKQLLKGQSQVLLDVTLDDCTEKCSKSLHWCRSFIYKHGDGTCTIIDSSYIIAQVDPVVSVGHDLYSYNCITPLGLSSGKILNQDISATSRRGNALASHGRLYNVPKGSASTFTYWTPADNDPAPYLQVDLKQETRITGISTQGHYDRRVLEYAYKYQLRYWSSSNKKWTKKSQVYNGNTKPVEVVHNKLNHVASKIRVYPIKNQGRRIALRMELYGCPKAAQGISDESFIRKSFCNSNPCLNGGKCFNLKLNFKCVCKKGYLGKRCDKIGNCKISDLDIPLNGILSFSNHIYTSVKCKDGFSMGNKLVNFKINCINGQWENKIIPKCIDINECSENKCSGICENSIGSFRCSCPRGMKMKMKNQSCQNINECQLGYHGCEHRCVDTDGSFDCTCPVGYHAPYNGSCYDIDECGTLKHDCEQVCENRLASYTCSCKPGYYLARDKKSCIHIKCPNLPNISRGNVHIIEDKAWYMCNTGYKLDGLKTRTCNADGSWSGKQPRCKAIYCTLSWSPENGRFKNIQGSNYGFLSIVECYKGYKLIGSPTRVCSSNSLWSSDTPRCVVEACPQFSVSNGKVVGLGRTHGSIVRIECNEGYKLQDERYLFRTCLNNGRWTGGNVVIKCQAIRCNRLPYITNGYIKNRNSWHYNSVVSYACNAGFCIDYDQKVSRCQSSGQWSGTTPICRKSSCCRPHVPRHAKLYSSHSYKYGDFAYIKCNKGYKTGGDDYRKCNANGRWSGSDTSCTLHDCGDPGPFLNGVIYNKQKTTYETTIGYFCNVGYYMSGNLNRTCMANGQWSGTQPNCIKSSGSHVRRKSGSVRCQRNQVCHYLFQVTQGKKVSLQFNIAPNMGNGKIVVYDSASYSPFVEFSAKHLPLPITSSGHLIRVITDVQVSINFKETGCGGLLNSERGDITTPNYPNKYDPNLDCYWTIHRPLDMVQLKFLNLKIQDNPVDFVTVREKPFQNSKVLLHNFYGEENFKLVVESSDNWYWIHFKSDAKIEERGFYAIYELYDPYSQ